MGSSTANRRVEKFKKNVEAANRRVEKFQKNVAQALAPGNINIKLLKEIAKDVREQKLQNQQFQQKVVEEIDFFSKWRKKFLKMAKDENSTLIQELQSKIYDTHQQIADHNYLNLDPDIINSDKSNQRSIPLTEVIEPAEVQDNLNQLHDNLDQLHDNLDQLQKQKKKLETEGKNLAHLTDTTEDSMKLENQALELDPTTVVIYAAIKDMIAQINTKLLQLKNIEWNHQMGNTTIEEDAATKMDKILQEKLIQSLNECRNPDEFEALLPLTETNKSKMEGLQKKIEDELKHIESADTIHDVSTKKETLNYLKQLLKARLNENNAVENDSETNHSRSPISNEMQSTLIKRMSKDDTNNKPLANTARDASVAFASAIGMALTIIPTSIVQHIYKEDPNKNAEEIINAALKKENKKVNYDALCCHLSSKIAVAQVLDEGNRAEKELESLKNISNKHSNEPNALQPTLTKRVAARDALKTLLNARAAVLKRSRSECNEKQRTAKDLLNPHTSGAQRYRLTLKKMKTKNAGSTDSALKQELIKLLNESSEHLRKTNHITKTDADQVLYKDLQGDESNDQIGNRIKKIQDKHFFHLNEELQEKWLRYSAMPSTYLPTNSDLNHALSRARDDKIFPHKHATKAHEEMINNPWLNAIFALDPEHQAEAFEEMKSVIESELSGQPKSPFMRQKNRVTFDGFIKGNNLILKVEGESWNPAKQAKIWRNIALQKIALKAIEHLSKEKIEELLNETANTSPGATNQQQCCPKWMKKSTLSVSPKQRLDRLKTLLGGQEAYNRLFEAKDTLNTCERIIEKLNNIQAIGDQITVLKEEIDSANAEGQENTEENTEEKAEENTKENTEGKTKKYQQLIDEYNKLVESTKELVKKAKGTNSDVSKSIETTRSIDHSDVSGIITGNIKILEKRKNYFQGKLETSKGKVKSTIDALKDSPAFAKAIIGKDSAGNDRNNNAKTVSDFSNIQQPSTTPKENVEMSPTTPTSQSTPSPGS